MNKNNCLDFLKLASLFVAGLVFVAACAAPFILALALHTIN